MRLWYLELKDITYQSAYMALRRYVSTNKFAPTNADIREQVAELNSQNEENLNETAAWQLVWKAICNSGYHAEEEFEKLPETIQRAVGSASQLHQWALSEVNDNTISFWRSDFQRIYRIEQQKELERRKLGPDILKRIQGQNMTLEQKDSVGIEHKENRDYIPMPDNIKNKLKKLFQED